MPQKHPVACTLHHPKTFTGFARKIFDCYEEKNTSQTSAKQEHNTEFYRNTWRRNKGRE
jgi:hypothetical protein